MRLPAFVLLAAVAASLPAPALADDPFGEEVTLTSKPMVLKKGSANWDAAFDKLREAFKQVQDYVAKEGLKPAGPAMTVYTATDDTGFQFEAGIPVEEPSATPPSGGLVLGKSPEGKALKFVHRGSYDSMDSTYEAITNYLDERRLDAKDLFVEEYATDPVTTPEDQLVVNVYVPTR